MESHLPADSLSPALDPAGGGGHPARVVGPGADLPGETARIEARAGLYVHVPFCATRCSYCDFSSGSLSAAALDRYVSALALEAERRSESARGVRFHSVFFGGGTPSALPERHFRAVWGRLRDCFEIAPGAEVTLEANPESVRASRLEAWAGAGVNRLSMGAQSFVPAELETLGRVHSADRPGAAIALARAHGIRRLSLDLMFGFPGHTAEHLDLSLETALSLGIDHLSAYCFIPEPGTPLGDAVAPVGAGRRLALPSPDEQAELYVRLTATCARHGLHGYETSNFCRPGAEARHNLVYWLRRPYLGLGPSAHSLMDGERFANHYAFTRWARALEGGESPECEREACSKAAIATEIVMLALRLGHGLDRGDYPECDWLEVERRYGAALDRAVKTGRLDRTAMGWRVAPESRFVADEAIAWVLARERAPFDRGSASSIMASCPSLPSPAI